MTERLYYTDCYLRCFEAEAAVSDGGLRVYLDRSAFYPTSGGQLADRGILGGARVVDVIDEGERVAHLVDSPLEAGLVACEIDWPRRFLFMQQHTGQHLLSAVFHELLELQTVAVHLGEDYATVELAAAAIRDADLQRVEARANAAITENRSVAIGFESAASAEGLRKASEREGTLRIVTIDGLDKSACGGTHVRSTGEIGVLLIRKTEKIRGNTRVEFVCGGNAVKRARTDYDLLSASARAFSSPLEDVPGAILALQESAKESAKALKKVQLELAAYKGRELYATSPGRYWLQGDGALDDSVRALAQAYTAAGVGVFLATAGSAVLVASSDPAVHCGNLLKELLA
ncbi:MAG: alanyl-tRNA editing protein, partial [Phycisphaerales bacterium]|nr:alanyl-tRNA editing protein [Phycisphaerales bacterium]